MCTLRSTEDVKCFVECDVFSIVQAVSTTSCQLRWGPGVRLKKTKLHAWRHEINPPVVLPTPAPFRDARLTLGMEAFNLSMSRVRTSVEWIFGDVIKMETKHATILVGASNSQWVFFMNNNCLFFFQLNHMSCFWKNWKQSKILGLERLAQNKFFPNHNCVS